MFIDIILGVSNIIFNYTNLKNYTLVTMLKIM